MRWFGLILLVFSFGIDGNCDGGAGLQLPAAQCITTFFNEEANDGFSPPSDFTGPVFDPIIDDDRTVRAEWLVPGEDGFTFSFFSTPSDETLEGAAARTAQIIGYHNTVIKYEPIVLNSGQRGWIIVGVNQRFPDDITLVSTILIRNNQRHEVTAIGTTLKGTNDLDFLIGVAKTLCAE